MKYLVLSLLFPFCAIAKNQKSLPAFEDLKVGSRVVISDSAGRSLQKILLSKTDNTLTWKLGTTCEMTVPNNPILPPISWKHCMGWSGEIESGENIYKRPKGELKEGDSWKFKVKQIITSPRKSTDHLTAECHNKGEKSLGTNIGVIKAQQVDCRLGYEKRTNYLARQNTEPLSFRRSYPAKPEMTYSLVNIQGPRQAK